MAEAAASWPSAGWEPTRVSVAGWDTTCLVAGPEDGPLALLLHGFPDSPSTWRHLGPELVADGWRVVLPWMPHYGPTRPERGRPWSTSVAQLTAFAVALREVMSPDTSAVIIGHDWGAITANEVASRHPEVFDRAVTLAVAPMSQDAVATFAGRQLINSAYTAVLGAPLGWRGLRPGNWMFVERLWRWWSPGWEAGDIDRRGWQESLARDGGRGAAGYYRWILPALVSQRWPGDGGQSPAIPTLHLGGVRDGCVGVDVQRRGAAALAEHSQARWFDGLGHFLHLEDPSAVNAAIRTWINPVLG